MAIQLNDLKLTTGASSVIKKLPAATAEVLAAADRTAAINQDLIAVLRPDLLGRADLLADSSNVDTARAAAILAAVDAGLLGTLRPDLLGTALQPEQSQAAATLATGIPRVSPGELITAERINAIIDRLNALGGNPSVSLGGDVTGTASANRVVALQGRGVASTAPAQGQVLGFANGVWQPTTPAQVTTPAPAMRLVAAGLVTARFFPINHPTPVQYLCKSILGNLGVRAFPNVTSPIILSFDAYDPTRDWVVHTAQRQLQSGKLTERLQTFVRIDLARPNAPPDGIALWAFDAKGNADALTGELFVEIYQPPLTFTALQPVKDFTVSGISTVEEARLNNPPKTVEPATTPNFATAELVADPVVNPVFTADPAAEPASASPAAPDAATLDASVLGVALASNPGALSGLTLRTGSADTVLRADTASTAATARGGDTAPDGAAATPTTKAARPRKSAAKAAPAPAKARKR